MSDYSRPNEKPETQEKHEKKTHLRCNLCGRIFPLEYITPNAICVSCESRQSVAEVKEEQVDKAKVLMAEVLDSSKIPYAEKPQINDVCAAIVEYFGGMRKFVVRWGEEFEKAMDMYPGRIGNLQHFAKIVELIRDANRLDHDKDVAEMSDEQIRREQELLLIQMISEAASTGNQVKVVKNLCESLGLSPQEVLPQIGLEEEEDDGPA